jgi:magnesium chelatase subunit I
MLPEHLIEVIARFTRLVRASPAVDSRSGVSARFAIAAAEAVAASAVRRAAISGEEQPVARVCDLPATIATLRGKVEFEVSEEGREQEVLDHLLRRATAETFRGRLGSADLTGLLARFGEGATVETGDLLPAADLLRRIGEVPGLAKIMERLQMDGGESLGQAAAALEFALEGLYLMRRLSKDSVDGGAVYRT